MELGAMELGAMELGSMELGMNINSIITQLTLAQRPKEKLNFNIITINTHVFKHLSI